MVRHYQSEACDGETEWMRLRNGPLLASKPRRMGMPLWAFHENAGREVFVVASPQAHFMFFGDDGVMNCAVPAAVELQGDNDYELLFDSCRVSFSRLVVDGAAPARRQLIRRFEPLGNAGCKKAFEKSRFF